MNMDRLKQMAEWLEDGAPHVVFDMKEGGENIETFLEDNEGDEEDDRTDRVRLERDQKGLGSCGTICCIAGYALQSFGTKKEKVEHFYNWGGTARFAMGAFGLPVGTAKDVHMHHDLFDPNLAPDDCTPQQAAQAVRNVMAGDVPWDATE